MQEEDKNASGRLLWLNSAILAIFQVCSRASTGTCDIPVCICCETAGNKSIGHSCRSLTSLWLCQGWIFLFLRFVSAWHEMRTKCTSTARCAASLRLLPNAFWHEVKVLDLSAGRTWLCCSTVIITERGLLMCKNWFKKTRLILTLLIKKVHETGYESEYKADVMEILT